MVDLTTGLAFLTNLGLPQILLWVLTFAIVYAALKHIINKRAAALISIAVGFLVLMAVPAALIAFIASMSTGLVAVALGLIVLVSALAITGVLGSVIGEKGHPVALALLLVIIAVVMFIGFGGLGFIGISGIPTITSGTWLLIIVGVAVLWMLSEKLPEEKAAEAKR